MYNVTRGLVNSTVSHNKWKYKMDIDLLKLLVERTSYINTYWNFYIVVATAIVGIVASGKVDITRNIRIVLTVAFILFTYSNYHAIENVNEQRNAISKNIKNKELVTIKRTFEPNEYWKYLLFHLLLDITVLVSIWRIRINNKKTIKKQ